MKPSIAVVGHPLAPIGMGEHIRATARALVAIDADVHLRDVYGLNKAAVIDTAEDILPLISPSLKSDVGIFVLNGDERKQAFTHLGSEVSEARYKIAYPAWELSKYPAGWARELEHYDEIWAASEHAAGAFKSAVSKPVVRMPLPGEPAFAHQLSRQYFVIPDSAFVYFFSFDFTSFIERKNPRAVIAAFEGLVRARPQANVMLVLKINNADRSPTQLAELRESLQHLRKRVRLLDGTMTDSEIKGLIRCSNVFVSLHRAEGFGFGMIEAMYFGKPVIATAYSGNMEFTTADTTCLVDYRLIPVKPGEYPHGEGQVWADPDVDQATGHMIKLADDHGYAAELGARASQHVRTHFSRRAIGLRYAARLESVHRR